MNRDPSNSVFHLDANTRTMLLSRYHTHKKYVDNSSINSSAAQPKDFTADVKWVDWKPTFANYLRTLPGRDGVPIKYVIRPDVMGNPAPQTDMLNGYINMAPLNGPSYDIDNLQVLTLLAKFIVGNYDAEATVQTLNTENRGCRMLHFHKITHNLCNNCNRNTVYVNTFINTISKSNPS